LLFPSLLRVIGHEHGYRIETSRAAAMRHGALV
jgi:hypothetical protein